MVRIKERLQMMLPIFVPFVFYIGSLVFSVNWLDVNPDSSGRFFIALLPILPSIWIAFSFMGFMKKLDELERKIINEAAAFSFMITFLMILAFTFLEQAGILTPNPVYISLFMALFLVIGKVIGNRRYK